MICDSIHLAISDNGAGLKPSKNGQKGIGLEVMRHRASVIGANLDVNSMGCGTTVSCELLKAVKRSAQTKREIKFPKNLSQASSRAKAERDNG